MNRILVKSVNWVGDAVMVTPFLRVLRRTFPEAHVTLLARPSVADVFEANPDVDRLWVGDERVSLRRFREIAARIRRERFDLGIALPNSSRSALLLALGRARRRLGYKRDGRGWLLTDGVEPTPEMLNVHEVEYYIHLLRRFGDVDAHPRELVVPPGKGTDRHVHEALEKHGLDAAPAEGRPLVGLCPGAAYGTAKRWLPDRFAAVADHVAERWNAQSVVVGAPSERAVGDEVARLAKCAPVVLSGTIPLRVSIALLDQLSLFITNDCGSMHLAAARGLPLVAIFGPTNPTNTAPYHRDAVILQHPDVTCVDNPCGRRDCPREHVCMTSIPVEEVARAADRLLEVRLGRSAESTGAEPGESAGGSDGARFGLPVLPRREDDSTAGS